MRLWLAGLIPFLLFGCSSEEPTQGVWVLTYRTHHMVRGEPVQSSLTETLAPEPFVRFAECERAGRAYVADGPKRKGIYRGFRCEVRR